MDIDDQAIHRFAPTVIDHEQFEKTVIESADRDTVRIEYISAKPATFPVLGPFELGGRVGAIGADSEQSPSTMPGPHPA